MSCLFPPIKIRIVCNSRVFSHPKGLMFFVCWVLACNRQVCTNWKTASGLRAGPALRHR